MFNLRDGGWVVIHPIVFGKFILLERVSVGGMAEVYRAKLLNAPEIERFFAIKRILPHLAADKEFVSMFINEAKVAVELEHPNVCQIYELGRLGQSHYIAMEFIAGRDVLAIQSHYRRQKKIMSVSQSCFIIAQAAQGLDYAHKAVDSSGNPLGLVHRDVSPQNLLVTYDGVVKLIDFGVSKASRRASHSKSGVVKGKFSYMSPEQAADKDVDHRSDIFALGVVFWELLTGRRLFQSESEFAIMEMIQECNIEKPSKYNKMVPDAVDKICMKALEHDVDKRYQWAGEMVLDLFEFINSCKTPFTQWHLQNWMCAAFKEELEREWELLPIFKAINTVADIEKYNREHVEAGVSDSNVSSENVKTEDISALSPEEVEKYTLPESSDEKAESIASHDIRYAEPTAGKSQRSVPIVGAAGSGARKVESLVSNLPPIPGRGIKSPGESSKSMPGVKSVSLSGIKPAEKDVNSSGPRLSICATKAVSEEDVVFEPEGVDPTEADPNILHIQRAERKARTRKGLMVLIIAICFCLIASPFLFYLKIIELPKPHVDLPTTASVQFNVVPESTQVAVKLYSKERDLKLEPQYGAHPKFENLQAGVYYVDVALPDYRSETFKLTLENGSNQSRLEMTHPLPKHKTYTVNISPSDAILYLNGKRLSGTGSPRSMDGIVGNSYQLRAFRAGYEPVVLTGTIESAMRSLDISLDPAEGISLQIDSEPSRAMVYFVQDGKEIRKGETPILLYDADVSKPLKIEVRKPGFQTWTYDLDFGQLETSDVRLFGDLESEG